MENITKYTTDNTIFLPTIFVYNNKGVFIKKQIETIGTIEETVKKISLYKPILIRDLNWIKDKSETNFTEIEKICETYDCWVQGNPKHKNAVKIVSNLDDDIAQDVVILNLIPSDKAKQQWEKVKKLYENDNIQIFIINLPSVITDIPSICSKLIEYSKDNELHNIKFVVCSEHIKNPKILESIVNAGCGFCLGQYLFNGILSLADAYKVLLNETRFKLLMECKNVYYPSIVVGVDNTYITLRYSTEKTLDKTIRTGKIFFMGGSIKNKLKHIFLNADKTYMVFVVEEEFENNNLSISDKLKLEYKIKSDLDNKKYNNVINNLEKLINYRKYKCNNNYKIENNKKYTNSKLLYSNDVRLLDNEYASHLHGHDLYFRNTNYIKSFNYIANSKEFIKIGLYGNYNIVINKIINNEVIKIGGEYLDLVQLWIDRNNITAEIDLLEYDLLCTSDENSGDLYQWLYWSQLNIYGDINIANTNESYKQLDNSSNLINYNFIDYCDEKYNWDELVEDVLYFNNFKNSNLTQYIYSILENELEDWYIFVGYNTFIRHNIKDGEEVGIWTDGIHIEYELNDKVVGDDYIKYNYDKTEFNRYFTILKSKMETDGILLNKICFRYNNGKLYNYFKLNDIDYTVVDSKKSYISYLLH